jgi:hypothetical protein
MKYSETWQFEADADAACPVGGEHIEVLKGEIDHEKIVGFIPLIGIQPTPGTWSAQCGHRWKGTAVFHGDQESVSWHDGVEEITSADASDIKKSEKGT